VLEIKAGQLLTTTKPGGLFVLTVTAEKLIGLERIVHEDLLFSKRIPIGEIFLCLEVKYYDTELSYAIKILYKDQVYYAFCDINEVRIIT
jgi:hypothetical protein